MFTILKIMRTKTRGRGKAGTLGCMVLKEMSSGEVATGAKKLTYSKKLKRKLDAADDNLGPSQRKEWKPSPPPTSQQQPGGKESRRCGAVFFDRPCEELAKSLLGCALFRDLDGDSCWGRVVETEAYLGGEDKAAHSYDGKRTERNEAMYMPAGTAYVYSIYGMHRCFNISSRGDGAAVLIRALEPLGGVANMKTRRRGVRKEKDLCNGPAKLCKALGIGKECDRLDLVTSEVLWVELPEGAVPWGEVVESGRIGVQYAGEWADRPLRFYLKDCPYVSKR